MAGLEVAEYNPGTQKSGWDTPALVHGVVVIAELLLVGVRMTFVSIPGRC